MSGYPEDVLIVRSKEFKADIDSLRKARQLEDAEVLDEVRDTLAKKWGLSVYYALEDIAFDH